MELRRSAPGVLTTIVCPFYIDTGMFAGVKTRTRLLLPILKQEKVARRLVRAVQLNHRRLFMPPMVYTVPAMRVLPIPFSTSSPTCSASTPAWTSSPAAPATPGSDGGADARAPAAGQSVISWRQKASPSLRACVWR